MLKILAFLLSLSVLALEARAAGDEAEIILSGTAVAGQKMLLKTRSNGAVPASSFYRVNFECPGRPDKGEAIIEAGYPESDIIFTLPGLYECEAELGMVTKSSCAGVQYRRLKVKKFSVSVSPADIGK